MKQPKRIDGICVASTPADASDKPVASAAADTAPPQKLRPTPQQLTELAGAGIARTLRHARSNGLGQITHFVLVIDDASPITHKIVPRWHRRTDGVYANTGDRAAWLALLSEEGVDAFAALVRMRNEIAKPLQCGHYGVFALGANDAQMFCGKCDLKLALADPMIRMAPAPKTN